MTRRSRFIFPSLLLAAAAAAMMAAGPACKGGTRLTGAADKALAEQEATEAADKAASEEAAAKPEPKPEPKVNDAMYVEITARSVLIREKYAETPETIDPEIDKVYDAFSITAADYREFAKTLVPPKSYELQKKIQEKIQTLAHEYR